MEQYAKAYGLNKKVDKLFSDLELHRPYPSHEDRVQIVEKFLEDNDVTDPIILERLGTYILKEDRRKYKGSKFPENLEHPYLSERQARSRHEKEVGSKPLQYIDSDRNHHKELTRDARLKAELRNGILKFK